MSRRAPALLLVLLLAAGCGEEETFTPLDVEAFSAALVPLNRSGVTGTVEILDDGSVLAVRLEAQGLAPDIRHAQHVHLGSSCPGPAQDVDGDGWVDVYEGIAVNGPILVPLDGDLTTQDAGSPEGFPVADAGGAVVYLISGDRVALDADLHLPDPDPEDQTVKLRAGEELRLENRTVVLHGVDPATDLPPTVGTLGDEPPHATLPVACGALVRAR